MINVLGPTTASRWVENLVRRITPSQHRAKIRQLQQQRQQAVDRYNREVRKFNQRQKQAFDRYNSAVRSHNVRVRMHNARLQNALSQLKAAVSTPVYSRSWTAIQALKVAHQNLEIKADDQLIDGRYNEVLDLSEKEAADGADLYNFVVDNVAPSDLDHAREENAKVSEFLFSVSEDLGNRWRGALFALKELNPDAARHFCTSAREVLNSLIIGQAPDSEVLNLLPSCKKTDDGRPTRRARISFLLARKEISDDALSEFIECDIDSVVAIFRDFNDATHGPAGVFEFDKLVAIKARAENAILYLKYIIK